MTTSALAPFTGCLDSLFVVARWLPAAPDIYPSSLELRWKDSLFLHKDLLLNQAGPEPVTVARGMRCPCCRRSGSLGHPPLKLQAGSALPKTTWIEQGAGRSESSRKIGMLFPAKGGKRLGRQKQQMSTPTAFQLTIHRSPGASYIQRTEKESDSTDLTIFSQ